MLWIGAETLQQPSSKKMKQLICWEKAVIQLVQIKQQSHKKASTFPASSYATENTG